MSKTSRRVSKRNSRTKSVEAKRLPEPVAVAPPASNPEGAATGLQPIKGGGVLVTFSTGKQAIAVDFYNTAEGIRYNVWEWDGRPTSELYNLELQALTGTIRSDLHHGRFTVKPRAALEAYETLHEPPASLRPARIQIDGPDNKINLTITEGKCGFRVYSGRLFEPLRRIALHPPVRGARVKIGR